MQFDVCKHIPQHDFTLVSEHYAQSRYLEPKHFRRLLFQLGVSDCIQAPRQKVVLSPTSKPTSPWADVDLGEAPEGGWIIQDYSAEEFEAVVRSVLAAEGQRQASGSMQYLAEMLSAHWVAHLSHWQKTTCVSQSGEVHSECVPTSCT